VKAGPRTSDPAEGRRLWALSEQLAAQARKASACVKKNEVGSTPW
jgi:hypothetical protein